LAIPAQRLAVMEEMAASAAVEEMPAAVAMAVSLK
jgi:hypothetical protein